MTPVPDRANVQQCLHWACDATRYGRLHLGPVEVAGLIVLGRACSARVCMEEGGVRG